MTYVAWPVLYVNKTVLQDGYNETDIPSLIITKNDTGAVKIRRRSLGRKVQYSIQLRFDRVKIVSGTYTEFSCFKYYVDTTLCGGVLGTNFPLNIDSPDTFIPCTFVCSEGKSPYTVTKWFGDYVYVTFTLERFI